MYIRIEKKVHRQIIQKILLLVLLALAITVLLVTSFKYCDRWQRIFSIILSGVIYLYLFYKIKLIPLLRDKEWTGTVDSRACKKVTRIKGVVAHRGNIQDVIIALWKIRRDDGEELLIEYDTEDIADNYFRTGDRVRHFKGAKFIVLANPEADNENLLCPLCGKLVMKPECSFCKIDFSMPAEADTIEK